MFFIYGFVSFQVSCVTSFVENLSVQDLPRRTFQSVCSMSEYGGVGNMFLRV